MAARSVGAAQLLAGATRKSISDTAAAVTYGESWVAHHVFWRD